MGEVMSVARLVAELRKDNEEARSIDLQVYAQALRTYYEASENIDRNGAICAHPRTGVPVENPYLKVAAAQAVILGRLDWVESDRVVEMLEDEAAAARGDLEISVGDSAPVKRKAGGRKR